jgi:hypothetical protein
MSFFPASVYFVFFFVSDIFFSYFDVFLITVFQVTSFFFQFRLESFSYCDVVFISDVFSVQVGVHRPLNIFRLEFFFCFDMFYISIFSMLSYRPLVIKFF